MEQEEEDADVTDIIGGDIENKEEGKPASFRIMRENASAMMTLAQR